MLIKLGHIDCYDWGRAFMSTLFLAGLVAPLVLRPFGGLRLLLLLLLLLESSFSRPSFRFVNPKVFQESALGVDLSIIK